MKKIMLIIALLLLLIALIVGIVCLTRKTPIETESGDVISGDVEEESEEVFVPIVDRTEGNGTSFVSYKGNIYYIELLNDDYEDATMSYDFAKGQSLSNVQRRMNIIHPNGKVENLFNITGATEFSIYEDRFYFVKSNGMLHTVDMKGQDDKELGRGKFVCFDTNSHKAYYTLSNDNKTLWMLDMQTLEISRKEYSNAYGSDDSYVFLGYFDGSLYYYKIDSTYDNIMFVKHDLTENKDYNILTEKIEKTREQKTYANEPYRYVNKLNSTNDRLKYISVGYLEGSGLFFSYGKLYEFDMQSGDATIITESLDDERVNLIGDKLYYADGNLETFDIIEYDINKKSKVTRGYDDSLLGNKALINFDGVYGYVDTPYSDAISKLANRYGLYESAFKQYISGDLVEAYPYIYGYSEYDIFSSDVRVIGNNVFYTINIARLDPTREEHARGTTVPVYIRRANEVYLYNLDSKNNTLVYAINNSNFIKNVRNIETQIEKDATNRKEDIIDDSINEIFPQNSEEEVYIDIDTSDIWKNEYDVRIEEMGGTIIGKRIEYEGHHLKSEGKLRIKIRKEHNARLVVYIDNEIKYDVVMD